MSNRVTKAMIIELAELLKQDDFPMEGTVILDQDTADYIRMVTFEFKGRELMKDVDQDVSCELAGFRAEEVRA